MIGVDAATEQLIEEVARRYVKPGHRFMYLVAGNLLGLNEYERETFGRRLAEDAREVTNDELDALFQGWWQERLTAAWLVGVDLRTDYRRSIAELLLDDEYPSAGQGYCFALARFGTAADAEILVAYLERYMPVFGGHQDWATGALMYLDTQLGTSRATPFLTPGGPWDQRFKQGWADSTYSGPQRMHGQLAQLCAFAETHALSAGPTTA
jgi:Family of unknown function (DUF6000)